MSKSPSSQFTLVPLSRADFNGQGRRTGVWLTLDRQRRLALSSEYRRKIGIKGIAGVPIYVAIDPAEMVIAIVKQDVTRTIANAASLRVNKDGYIYARALFDKLALKPEDGPHRFEYLGPIDHDGTRWDGFRLVAED